MFTDRLTTTLSLSIGSEVHALGAGQIERFSLDIQAWGFHADVTFYVSSEQEQDLIFEGFTDTTLLAATFRLARVAEGDEDTPGGITVTGYAVSKSVSEVVGASLSGAPVIGRRYEIRVVDAAQAFWTQHRPLELHVQTSMQDMIDLNKPTGVTITYDWPAVSTPQAVLTVGLDGEGEPSFYDFLLHWVDRNQGVFELDTVTNSYRLGAKKSANGSATAQSFEDVSAVRLSIPEPPRFVARVLQAFADAPLTKELPNALAAGIRRDVLLRTPIAADLSQRALLETARLRPRLAGIELRYRRCPDTLTPPLGLIELGDGFSQRLFAAGTTYRVMRLRASAHHKPEVPVEPEDDSAVYEVELTLDAEDKLNPVPALPAFRDPRRTLRVEGKIVSAGQSGQRTWAAIENEDDSLWMYKVQIPLFNKQVPAPFAPNFATGHFFFPAYKDQRVLVDLEFDSASITGFLDWADEGRLPSDTQGNQIVMGPEASNGTVIRHGYQDAIPVLNVERKASVETTTLTFGDGKVHIGLEQSSAVPTSIPLYDVSPQVEAAKDAVVGEVGGSVTVVTTQFQTAVGQVSGSIDEASAAVQTEISASERKLTVQLDAAQNELQGMLADASAAGASLAMGGQRCKARLQAALATSDTVRAPLLEQQARLSRFRQAGSLEIKAIESDIAGLPAVLAAPLDAASLRAVAVRDRAKNRFHSLAAAIASLSPRADAGVFVELTRFRQSVSGLNTDIAQVHASLEGRVNAFVGTTTAEWTQLDAALSRARSASRQGLERGATDLEEELTLLSGRVQTKTAAATPADRVRLTALSQRLRDVHTRVEPSLQSERARLDGLLEQTSARVSQGRAQLNAAAAASGEGVKSGIAAASEGAQQVLTGVDRLQIALESAAAAAVDRLEAALKSLEQAVMAALDAVPAAIATAKSALQSAVQSAVDACRAGLLSFDRLLSDMDSAARVPLEAALTALDTAVQVAELSVTTAGQTLDATLGTAQRTIDGFVTTFQSLVDGADTALTAVRSLIAGASASIMPPIDALVSLTEQLQSIFQTGVNLLTAFVDTAHAALDAIPAASLPKAMVQPAVTAISAALDAVLPVIQTAAKTAGDQLGNLGSTLAAQVQTAETTALTAVSTLVTNLTTQIEAILPSVREQLATVQTQIDDAIEGVLTQIDQATTLAVDGITQGFDAAATQAETVLTAASALLDGAEAQLQQLGASARAQLATQRAALVTRAQALLGQVATTVDNAQGQLDATAQDIEAGITRARQTLQTQLSQGLDPLQLQVDALRVQLTQMPDSVDQRLSLANTQNRALIAEITGLLPTDADIAAGVSTAMQPLRDAASALEKEVAAL